MRRPSFGLAILPVLLTLPLAPGCGPNCQETCNHLYEAGECGIERPGRSTTELRRTCMQECEGALLIPGDVPDDYDPYERTSGSVSVELETDEQAALWMECVAETSCEYLESGYCAPVW